MKTKKLSRNYLSWLLDVRYTMMQSYFESAGLGDFYKDVVCKDYDLLSSSTMDFLCLMVDVFRYDVSVMQLHSAIVWFGKNMILDRL